VAERHTRSQARSREHVGWHHVKPVICEPFRLPVNDQVKAFQDIASRLAEKYHAPLVQFQRVFDEANQRVGGKYWIWDAVHPTYSGHQLIADEWVRTVEAFYGIQESEP
jgi:lysophospholipase L1-like esterase